MKKYIIAILILLSAAACFGWSIRGGSIHGGILGSVEVTPADTVTFWSDTVVFRSYTVVF